MTRIEAEAVTTAAHKQKKKVKQQLIGCICASHGRQPAGIIKVGGALKCLTRGRSVVVFRVPFFLLLYLRPYAVVIFLSWPRVTRTERYDP